MSAPGAPSPSLVPGIAHVIAISSGKGGVGKSTVTVNVAVALAARGLRVGVLDADITGPNIPMMFGVSGQPGVLDGRVQTHARYGVRLMSIGFLVDPERPIIWRGPMVGGAIQQLMRDVDWGTLDYLLVDMPPGTSDAQLTLVQSVPLAGAVLVSTPQAVALGDTVKGLMMFRQTQTPILGIVENMSYFHCPHCGKPSELFKRGTVRGAAERYEVPYLGDVPFDIECREGGDSGVPVTVARPDSEAARAFRAIAENIVQVIAGRAQAGAAPRVVPITRREEAPPGPASA